MSVDTSDIQDQFDLWFPHGAVYQVTDEGGDTNSFISPWVKVLGGSLAQPQIEVTGDPLELGFRYLIDRWDITQADPLVLAFTIAGSTDGYQLGARVPDSVWEAPEFQAEREALQQEALV